MKIKSKVAVGVFSLFALILVTGSVAIYYIHSLSQDAKNIIRNNYESLQYTAAILKAADSLLIDSAHSVVLLKNALDQQEANITEPGEKELTQKIQSDVAKLSANPRDSQSQKSLRKHALAIQEVNLEAIVRKNELAQQSATRATTYAIILVSIFGIVSFSFIVNFPGYIANPIMQLTQSIKAIANKNYEERLHFDRNDEFEELAQAFNLMAEKLDEYEHSHLAKILFEKKRIETIINRMSDPVIGLDEHKKIVFANDQALQLLNLTHKQIDGKYAPDVAVENDLLRSLIRTDDTLEKSSLLKIIVSGKENYFSKEDIAIRYIPTGETETRIAGRVILLKNVTPYKELDLAKTNFIATISHELKTPIASLQLCAKLLNDVRIGKLNDEQSNIVKTLHDESTRLSKLVNELLDLSQVETGNIKLTLAEVDPVFIIDQALESVKLQAEHKSVKIDIIVPEKPGLVKVDRDKTIWVLINILTNAIRYSPEKGKIVIQLKKTENKTTFEVTDFGNGIEEKYLSKLFDKFFQVPGSSSGTGLGLSIAKEFIEAQGGTISAVSEPGKGSTFSFCV